MPHRDCRPFHVAALLLLATLAVPPGARAERFQLIFHNGLEACPLAYPDEDDDGYGGAWGVTHLCDPLPVGRLRVGGDCADADPGVHPGVPEPTPDGAYADENCDGVDGDASRAVFVRAGADGGAACGTPDAPCVSVMEGLARAAGLGRDQVYLGPGTYGEVVALPGGMAVYGGYDGRWNRARRTQPGHRAVIVGAEDDLPGGDGEFLTVRVHDSNAVARIENVEIHGPDARADGRSSYGVHVANARLQLVDVAVVGGEGAAGAAGSDGISNIQIPAPSGGQGGAAGLFVACNSISRAPGGLAGVYGTCSLGSPSGRPMSGGAGGAGGKADTSCPFDYGATGGSAGVPATFISGSAGTGGAGGGPNVVGCGSGSGFGGGKGFDGFTEHGQGGEGGMGATLAGRYWQAAAGLSGTTGENGGGGGGGGGSGGCDDGTDSNGAGGGGGGAGGCAALTPGTGGGGGGGSFGVFAVDGAWVELQACTIQLGRGGQGGQGGAGGLGQPGGSGGPGGLHAETSPAGSGGKGGHGGHSGAGGGGAGGDSVGVLRSFDSVVEGDCTTSLGVPGEGGEGGAAPETVSQGKPGAFGTAAARVVCTSGGEC